MKNTFYPKSAHVVNRTVRSSRRRTEDMGTVFQRPTINEVRATIINMKINIAPGDDNITAELFKYGGDTVETMTMDIINSIWESEEMSEGWTSGAMCLIHNKGDLQQHQMNYATEYCS